MKMYKTHIRLALTTLVWPCCILAQLNVHSTCGVERGCYHDCSGSGCGFLISWQYRPEVQNIHMSINKRVKHEDRYTEQWIALGLSTDKYMGDDSVIECVTDSNMYWLADVQHSYNDHHYNTDVFNSKAGLREVIGRMQDGVLTCNFTRTVKVGHMDRIFDLDRPWHLLVAYGNVKDGSKLRHSFYPEGPFVTNNPVDLREHLNINGRIQLYMIKTHGCLMILAWLVMTSVSVVIARYFKLVWSDSRACGRKVWYQVHKVLMLTVFLCVAASFIIIWIDVGGLSSMNGFTTFQRTHPILGVIIMGLTLLNPSMALLKPASGTLSRPVFKYAHTFIGRTVHILAILNIIVGVSLPKVSAPWYTVWIVTGVAVYQLVLEGLMEIYDWYLIKSGRQTSFEMKEPSTQETVISSEPNSPPGSSIKKFVLALHTLVVVGVGVTCMLLIAL